MVSLTLADPFTVFRLGVRTIMREEEDFEVSEVASLAELEGLLAAGSRPDLALVDLDLPPSGALNAVELLRRSGTAPIVWSHRARLSPGLVFELVQAGAAGVLSKEISPTGLVRALRGAMRGQAALGREIGSLLISGTQEATLGADTSKRMSALSSRELDVLELVSEGQANKEIAATLCISEFTVKRHVQNILRKLGVHSRWEAAASYRAVQRATPLQRSEAAAESGASAEQPSLLDDLSLGRDRSVRRDR
jgi:NarL family two-component system response regulator LiaR